MPKRSNGWAGESRSWPARNWSLRGRTAIRAGRRSSPRPRRTRTRSCRAATENHRTRAERMLEARPEIERDPWARLVLGRGWEGDPNAPGGPRGWAPILYVCHSCFASPALARELLERGADPNATFENEYGDMSALYGAAGVVHDPELTQDPARGGSEPGRRRVALPLGRDPGAPRASSSCSSTARPSTDPTRWRTRWTTRRSSTSACSLDAGADVTDAAYMAHAVRRGRGPEALRLLAEHGADLDAPGGETWRGDVPLRTPYQHAVIRGRDDLAETLAELGADTSVAPKDLALAALARGERSSGPFPEDPDAQEVIVMTALRGNLDAVIEAVGPNYRGFVGGLAEPSAHRPRGLGGRSRGRPPAARGGCRRDGLEHRDATRHAARGRLARFAAPSRAGPRLCRSRGAARRGRERDRAALPRGRRRAALRLAGG